MEVKTITEHLLFSTVRIEIVEPKEIEGTGTAFIFKYDDYLFLITNKHVVKDSTKGRFFFTLSDGSKPLIGERFDVELEDFEKKWFGHPSKDIDIAIMPCSNLFNDISNQGKNIFFGYLSKHVIPSVKQWKDFDALEEILFVGYPSGIFDEKNLVPILRRGITATPLELDYNGEKKFLIDASVFPGSSGSPVFICNQGSYSSPGGELVVGSRFFFLGIISEVLIRKELGEIEFVSIPTTKLPLVASHQMIDLGIVYKSTAILQLIEEYLRLKKPFFKV